MKKAITLALALILAVSLTVGAIPALAADGDTEDEPSCETAANDAPPFPERFDLSCPLPRPQFTVYEPSDSAQLMSEYLYFDSMDKAARYVLSRWEQWSEEQIYLSFPYDPYAFGAELNESQYPDAFIEYVFNLYDENPVSCDYLKWHQRSGGCCGAEVWDGIVSFYVQCEFRTTPEEERQVTAAVEEIIGGLDLDGKSEYDRIKAVYDWICGNVTYDFEGLDACKATGLTYSNTEEFRQLSLIYTAYAAAVRHKCVCEGYGLLLYRLMREAGIDCRCVVGYLPGQGVLEGHMWNIVKIGERYYNLDSTWDAGNMEYLFFLIPDSGFGNREKYEEYKSSDFIKSYPMTMVNYGEDYDYDFCGEGISWVYGDGTITFSGSGEIADFTGSCPWDKHYREVTGAVFGDGITRIGSNCLNGFKNLQSIVFPSTLTSIGDSAFSACAKLEALTLPGSLVTLEDNAFAGCFRLKTVNLQELSRLTTIGRYAFKDTSILDIQLPEGLKTVREGAFRTGAAIERLVIPSTIESLEVYALYCRVDELSIQMSITDWISFKDKSPMYDVGPYETRKVCFLGEQVIDLVIPSGIVTVPKGTFQYMRGITSAFIPNTVKCLDTYAFQSCTDIKTFSFEQDSSLETVSFGAFSELYSLESLELPDSVTTLKSDFAGAKLKHFRYPEKVHQLAIDQFTACRELEEVILPEGIDQIPIGMFDGCHSLKSIVIPDTVTAIGFAAFRSCGKLTEIIIPEGITSIGGDAFFRCTALESVIIPDSLTRIGDYAFYDCDALTDICYGGDQAQWNGISLGSNNEPLLRAALHRLTDYGSKVKMADLVIENTGSAVRLSVSVCIDRDMGEALAVCSVYDSAGRQLSSKQVVLKPGVFTDVDARTQGGNTIKLFVLDGESLSPLRASLRS